MANFDKIQQMLASIIEGTDIYVVDAKSTPGNNYKFALDADAGFGIDDSVRISRKLRKLIEEANLYPEGNFSLEVGSPGVDTPLTTERQFNKNIERLVELTFKDKEQKSVIGRLKAYNDGIISIEITDKRKKTSTIQQYALADCKKVVVQIEF